MNKPQVISLQTRDRFRICNKIRLPMFYFLIMYTLVLRQNEIFTERILFTEILQESAFLASVFGGL